MPVAIIPYYPFFPTFILLTIIVQATRTSSSSESRSEINGTGPMRKRLKNLFLTRP
jgi:hypothetical protein